MSQSEKNAWYEPGLAFTCTQCGNCCTGGPGYVWFEEGEGRAMARFLGLDKDEFYRLYARRLFGRWSLNEIENEKGEFDCVFLTAGEDGKRGCSIYPVRPTQCRTWPFWRENLRSEAAWQRAGRTCPGMTAGMKGQGKFYPADQIRIIRDSNPKF